MRYKVTLSYVGSGYAGFQSQINGRTIQDEIERALLTIFRKPVRIVSASRTDQGVHAYGQVFHFDAEEKDPRKLKYSMNGLLPPDIHINSVEPVSAEFHARYQVKAKTYAYLINNGERDVFYEKRAFQCHYDLDYEKMEECCRIFLGTHDFGSFNTSTYEEHPDQVRTVYVCRLIRRGDRLVLLFKGSGFLRHMVRIMTGMIFEVGRGKKTIAEVQEFLDHPCKSKRRYNIDPSGLYLLKIDYMNEEDYLLKKERYLYGER